MLSTFSAKRVLQVCVTLLLVAVISLGGLTACTGTANQADGVQSEGVLGKAIKKAKAFEATNFTLRETKNRVDALLDSPSLVGYGVVTSNTGVPMLSITTVGPCYPYSMQLTNPWMSNGAGSAAVAVAQIEPGTGTYSPPTSDGTMCVTTGGTIVQGEQPVLWSSSPIKLNTAPLYQLDESSSSAGKIDITDLRKNLKK